MRSVLKEPLVHFLIAGVLIFLAYGAIAPDDSPSNEAGAGGVIQVSQRDINRLAAEFESTWRRLPTEEEAAGLLEAYLTEEVLVREARKLGLESGDSVVRQRLRLKMEFLIEGSVMAADPGDEVLQAFVEENSAAFSTPARIAFQQVYLGETASDPEVAEVVAALNAGASAQDLGEQTLLPQAVPLSPARAINGTFGDGVFEALEAVPDGEWVGPVQSGYGVHVVRVTETTQAQMLKFEDVRTRALQSWREEQKKIGRAEAIAKLREQYEVSFPDESGA